MRKALVVGINDYPSAPLGGCINDATSFASIIENNGDGSPNFDVRLYTNVYSKSELKELIHELFQGESDTALFYFSGHGSIDDVGGYIVTPDMQPRDVGVSMDEILTMANNSGAKDKIIILDCCHSGALGSPRVNGATATQIAEGVTILTASRDSEYSFEVNGQGVFTTLLLDALKGGSADLRGHITPGSIYSYIDQALGPWDQRPVFKTNITRFTSLRTVNPQVPINTIRNLVKYFPSPEDEFELDPSFEDTNSPDVEHHLIEPYAIEGNVTIFKDLQKLEGVGLVVPVEEEHMYFAAMNSKSCKLSALGYHYWRLVKDRRI
ncbi:caspase family protein [Evansella tamaricis]|uniref:Caspase family protein n=1 Tax=Evansella tamaricis TaxID=2069301 RepID=A0ABS6JBS9_9BACI|nr:caspase family protein [Evansella tamaricis]MBU9710880.1 caspase family protein [Evansella tamaricis]